MASIVRPPYLRPKPDRVKVLNWLILERDGLRVLPRLLPDWDSASAIVLELGVAVDTPGIVADCRLSADAQLRVVAAWESSGTGLRGIGARQDFSRDEPSKSCTLEMSIPGNLLESDVTIKVELVIRKRAEQGTRLAPWLPGTRLWQDQRKVNLRGTGGRFPVDVVDFESVLTWLPPSGAWYLDWDRHEFDRPALGSMRLLVNSNHEVATRAVTQQLKDDEPVRQAITFDVARTMITAALANDDFIDDLNGFAAGSVGIAVRRHLHILFPDRDINDLRQENAQYPDLFSTRLQERLRLFWDGK